MELANFKTLLFDHAKAVLERAQYCNTEEATKTALILPFFQNVLGYDISDPRVFIPEYDIPDHTGRHERADYALMHNQQLEVLIEAKQNLFNLDEYKKQLARYFNATPARIGILTDGITYLFFSDLDNNGEMDTESHFELNLNDISESDVNVLYQYHAQNFNAKVIIDDAKKHQSYRSVKKVVYHLFSSPDKQFAKYIGNRIKLDGGVSCGIPDMQELTLKAVNSYIKSTTEREPQPRQSKSEYTQDQLEALYTIYAILHNKVPRSRLALRRTVYYASIHLDDKANRWICRLYDPPKGYLWQIHFPTNNPHKPDIYNIKTVDDLFLYEPRLLQAIKKQDPSYVPPHEPNYSYITNSASDP